MSFNTENEYSIGMMKHWERRYYTKATWLSIVRTLRLFPIMIFIRFHEWHVWRKVFSIYFRSPRGQSSRDIKHGTMFNHPAAVNNQNTPSVAISSTVMFSSKQKLFLWSTNERLTWPLVGPLLVLRTAHTQRPRIPCGRLRFWKRAQILRKLLYPTLITT